MSHRKRKHRQHENELHTDYSARHVQPDLSLFVQAHEADLVRGPQAAAAARSLEVVRRDENGKTVLEPGDGLIRWNGGGNAAHTDVEDHLELGREAPSKQMVEQGGFWVDRYDARLLLDALPDFPPANLSVAEPTSPDGWSDLPSDAEDTFFFSPQEVEDYRRQKRRRVIDEDRQARLRALPSEAGDEDAPDADPRAGWGGSDEEPDEAQHELMRRTAAHVHASPNPAQLEMRILANHGADPRFAFLRGRWSRAWRLTKGKLRLELEAKKAKEKEAAGIGGLAGYGDSDEDDNSAGSGEETKEADRPAEEVGDQRAENAEAAASDDALKAARRERAREWAEKRRAAREAAETPRESSP